MGEPRTTKREDPCAGDEASRACYDFRRRDSHKQQQRGFVGEQGSGDLQLDLQFRKHSNCVAVIAEAPVVTKTANQANWHSELEVKVEGEVVGRRPVRSPQFPALDLG